MSSSSPNNVTRGEDEIEELTTTPLWKYVTKVPSETTLKGGGSAKFICNFGCRTDAYTGSYTRVRAHLIGGLAGQKLQGIILCPKLKKEERELLKQEELNAQKLFNGNSKNKNSSLASVKSTVDNMFQLNTREEVDQKVARCLYACGVPFNIVRSPLWAEMIHGINNAPKGYKSPNYEKVRTTLLDKEQNKIQQSLTMIKQEWDMHGVSIVSDGWSNLKNLPLINVMAISGGKAMFLTAYDVASIEKNGENIANLLIKAIEKVGSSNVVQVLTDNASNCKAAGAIIERRYRHIFWSGCLAHTLNLLMKDIAKSGHPSLSYVDETYQRGKTIVKYIKNHSSCQHLYQTFSPLELLRAKKTRFGYHFIVIQRLVKVRASLVSMALSKQWESLRKSPNIEQHDIVHRTIMDDDFWRKTDLVLKITKPIYKMLRFSDSDKAVIGEVYEQMDNMLGLIKDTLANDDVVYDLIHRLVVERWNKMNIPLHCLAYILVPKYYTNAWLMKPAPGGVRRIKPHFDPEVQGGYLEAVDKMIRDPIEAALIRQQISDFVSNNGVFAHPKAVNDRSTMSALSWWHLYGGVAPDLYSLALRVLSQSVNTSCAERCWSTYSYIHSIKRNRLSANQAEKLVFVHYNHRLLTRYREDYETCYKNWDAFLEEDNIEEDIMTIEAREEEPSLSEEEDIAVNMTMISTPPNNVAPSVSTSNASLPSTAQENSIDQARKRLERAKGKRPRVT